LPFDPQNQGVQILTDDLVVLLDPDGTPSGTAPRATVHGPDTPLHLAFSCYLFDEDGRVLMTRRALAKRTWPGVWTNACCGHPLPGEAIPDAIERRLAQELGATATSLSCVLPDFRYEAVDASGVRENEVCPVYAATVRPGLAPDPDEVMEHRWVQPDALTSAAAASPWLLSPWSALQIGLMDLPALGLAATASR
jgi:isopentenyl-diphosphate delta-isomerase type 1